MWMGTVLVVPREIPSRFHSILLPSKKCSKHNYAWFTADSVRDISAHPAWIRLIKLNTLPRPKWQWWWWLCQTTAGTTCETIALTTLQQQQQQQCQARVCQLEGVAGVVSDDVSTMTRTHLWVSVLLAAVWTTVWPNTQGGHVHAHCHTHIRTRNTHTYTHTETHTHIRTHTHMHTSCWCQYL